VDAAKDGTIKKLTATSDIPRNALKILFFMSIPVLDSLDIKKTPSKTCVGVILTQSL
jgi:hypothetical protein